MGVCESLQHGSGAMLRVIPNVVDVRQCANLPNMLLKVLFFKGVVFLKVLFF